MSKPWTIKKLLVDYSFDNVYSILDRNNGFKEFEIRKVPTSAVDDFLLSGRFNSVLGPDGFANFKSQLKDVFKKVNSADFGLNYINLDKIYEALISSGIYYVESRLPEELQNLKSDNRWLTAYRYVARNFPNIDYKEFREVVKRFKDSDGHSFFITKDDSKGLQEIASHKELFTEAADAKATLLQLSQKDLRSICELVGAKPARTTQDTVDRIVELAGDEALKHVPDELKNRRTLFIRDLELANGNDIVNLDSYLRAIAKVVREDLTNFIDQHRRWSLLKERRTA